MTLTRSMVRGSGTSHDPTSHFDAILWRPRPEGLSLWSQLAYASVFETPIPENMPTGARPPPAYNRAWSAGRAGRAGQATAPTRCPSHARPLHPADHRLCRADYAPSRSTIDLQACM